MKTYEETLHKHFQSRKNSGKAGISQFKLDINKCEFAKGSILYSGWIVSLDLMIPDL